MRGATLFVVQCIMFLAAGAQLEIPPLEGWREHLPYHSAISVTAGNDKIFAATPYSLFSVDLADNSIERLSKINGLSETGISTIQFDEQSHLLFIGYNNSNIDLLDGSSIINIPDLKRENISGDKSIYKSYPYQNKFYLSTGLGIVVIDALKKEINATWYIGNNGDAVKVNDFIIHDNFYYAATDEGLKRSSTLSGEPADFKTWQNIGLTGGLPIAANKAIVKAGNTLYTLSNDSIFVYNGNVWSFFYADEWPVVNLNASENKLLLSQRKANGDSRVIELGVSGIVGMTLQQPSIISFPKEAIYFNGSFWVADLYGGLTRFFTNSNFERYLLSSPLDVANGQMVTANGIFYATAGSVNTAWNYQYNGNGIYQFANNEWKNFNRFNGSLPDSLMDFITMAVDPVDGSIWAGSFGGGLLHLKPDGHYDVFKQNSPIKETIGDPGSYRVAGLAFDAENNLWISNFGASQPLHVKKADGNWRSFSVPLNIANQTMAQIIIDDANQKWINSPLGNGLIVFNHGNDIDNTNDDQWRLYRAGRGNGNLPSNEILSLAKDMNGFIWVGTSDGIAIIECPGEAFSSQGCEAFIPVVQHGNFNGYLFKGQYVQGIAVDGANRKWIATNNGVWLVSDNGEKLIYHFTENNSPLFSNDVKQVSIDGNTGEVYFATSKGIVSFRSTATAGGETNKDVLVFPNPVPPGYTGTIAIRGLVENAIVKIIEPGGRLIFETRALGGQAIWNGRNYQGKQVASGAYIVLVNDDGRQEKAAAKIFFISK